MFERFTDRARRVVVYAQEEAGDLHHDYIGTEHLLLGLLHEGSGVGAKALTELGIDLDAVRADVLESIGQGVPGKKQKRHIPFTPRSKKVLELSLREALQLGHNYIGTEHILLGLVREGSGVASQILDRRGLTKSAVQTKVVEILSGIPKPPPLVPPSAEATYTDGAQQVLDAAAMTAKAAGEEKVGTPHLLEALAAVGGTAAQLFMTARGLDRWILDDTEGFILEGTTDEDIQDRVDRTVSVTVDDEGAINIQIPDEDLRARFLDGLSDGSIDLGDLIRRAREERQEEE